MGGGANSLVGLMVGGGGRRSGMMVAAAIPAPRRAIARRRWLIAAAATTVLALPAPAARAAPVPSSQTPLAGSTFQGGDGNQDDQAPSVDWQGLQAAGRVVHSPDDNAADTAFTGGSKEDAPGDWGLTTESGGVNPGKANVRDAWSVVDQPARDTFLYLGFTREQANGDTFIAFELNKDTRLWDNGRAQIPCRRTGDLLVVVAATGNGVEIVLQRWTTSQSDPATGCATRGSLDEVDDVASADAQGAVNPGPIVSRLPGAFPPSTTISGSGLFGEVALNLSALMRRAFGADCLGFGSIWMHSRSSESESANMQDYVGPQALAVRTCSASGTKFLDSNANGRFDPGERGLPRFLIWADYDRDGVRDAGEPFSVTDRQGRYVIYDIRPPNGTYTLRETLATAVEARVTSWVCSFPNAGTPGGFGNGRRGPLRCGWGPIVAADTPNAENRDFGNWLPARLTVEKELAPATDPGRFDLKVNGVTVFPAAGDGATTTIALRPGSYDVSEQAVPPTDPTAYRSTVSCRVTPRQRRTARAGTAFPGLVLQAGNQATCRFVNVRPGSPAIAIEKTGPLIAVAGSVLQYTLLVTNPGDVPIPASTVQVTDPVCDRPPALSDKAGAAGPDASPETLDPGDTWTYRCSHRTTPQPDSCVLSRVTNTATATGAADGTTVTDDDTMTTTLVCGGDPPQPPVPTPTPTPPTPPIPPSPSPAPQIAVLPAGPQTSPAGRAGVASLEVRGACVSRVSQVRLVGSRIARFSVTVDRRPLRSQTLAILQRTARPLSRVFAPGRHRVSVRVVFESGSGTPSVTLTRNVTVCRGLGPDFTG